MTKGDQTKRVGGDRDADLAQYPMMCFPSQPCGDVDAGGENEARIDMLQPKPATEFQELKALNQLGLSRSHFEPKAVAASFQKPS